MGKKRKKRKDYQQKNFNNPLYPEKHKKKNNIAKWIFLSLIGGIILYALYLGITNEFFTIDTIEVDGTQTISEDEIAEVVQQQLDEKRLFVFNQNIFFFFDKGKLKKSLNELYPLESVTIKKRPFDTVSIRVKEDIIPLFWFSQQKKYYVNSKAQAVKEVEAVPIPVDDETDDTQVIRVGDAKQDFPIMYDQSNRAVVAGQEVARQQLIDFAVDLNEEIQQQADVQMTHYTIENPFATTLTMAAIEGWDAHFSIEDDAAKQLNTLLLVLREKVRDRSLLEYIDLRFGEKVFYK